MDHQNAVFTLYRDEHGQIRSYLTAAAEMDALRREISELGELISVHPPRFEDEEVRKTFDAMCREEGWWITTLDAVFLLGFQAGRSSKSQPHAARLSSEDTATD